MIQKYQTNKSRISSWANLSFFRLMLKMLLSVRYKVYEYGISFKTRPVSFWIMESGRELSEWLHIVSAPENFCIIFYLYFEGWKKSIQSFNFISNFRGILNDSIIEESKKLFTPGLKQKENKSIKLL